MIFYNQFGRPIAYCDDGETIFLFRGKPVAYILNSAIFGFNGMHLGWIDSGWIRDTNGLCVFFSENATGAGPIKPMTHIVPIKGIKEIKPIRNIRQVEKNKAVNSLSWSPLSGEIFFTQ